LQSNVSQQANHNASLKPKVRRSETAATGVFFNAMGYSRSKA
jgi:hypothetical protein